MPDDLSTLADLSLVINLPSRPERLKLFFDRLAGVGIDHRSVTVFPGVDIADDPPPDWWIPLHIHAGHWGCRQAHIAALTCALANGADSVLVMEDDALLPVDFIERARGIIDNLPTGWLGVLFGYSNTAEFQQAITPCIGRLHKACGTYAYLLSRRGIQRLRSHWLWEHGVIDVTWHSLMEQSRGFYAATPAIVGHDLNFSDTVQSQWLGGEFNTEQLQEMR